MKNKPVQELLPLHFLLGKWKTSGKIFTRDGGIEGKIKGTDSYKLISDGHFILHQVDVKMKKERVKVMEMIGEFDPASGKYKMRSFDNQGVYSEMKGHFDDKGDFLIYGDKMRAMLTIVDNKHLIAQWDNSVDNVNWHPWMELQLTRI